MLHAIGLTWQTLNPLNHKLRWCVFLSPSFDASPQRDKAPTDMKPKFGLAQYSGLHSWNGLWKISWRYIQGLHKISSLSIQIMQTLSEFHVVSPTLRSQRFALPSDYLIMFCPGSRIALGHRHVLARIMLEAVWGLGLGHVIEVLSMIHTGYTRAGEWWPWPSCGCSADMAECAASSDSALDFVS